MTATSMRMRAHESTEKGPQATSLRILVGLTVAFAVVGVAIAGVLLARGAPTGTGSNVPGQPVETSFGAFTVTRLSTNFVPDTSGPPTKAQMLGTSGSNQLQVWIRLVNERAEQGLAYAPAQLRLVTDARSGKGRDPDGSSITPALLPRGGSIDGQVWFDLPKGSRSTVGGWFLEFKDPGGDAVRVALNPQLVVPAPAAPSSPAGGGADPHPNHGDSVGKP